MKVILGAGEIVDSKEIQAAVAYGMRKGWIHPPDPKTGYEAVRREEVREAMQRHRTRKRLERAAQLVGVESDFGVEEME